MACGEGAAPPQVQGVGKNPSMPLMGSTIQFAVSVSWLGSARARPLPRVDQKSTIRSAAIQRLPCRLVRGDSTLDGMQRVRLLFITLGLLVMDEESARD